MTQQHGPGCGGQRHLGPCPEPVEDWTKPPPVRTRVPRVFPIWGTIAYGVSSISALVCMLAMGLTGYVPPWQFLVPAYFYIAVSAGIICCGRIQSNRDAKVFIHALKKQSDLNKQRQNWRAN